MSVMATSSVRGTSKKRKHEDDTAGHVEKSKRSSEGPTSAPESSNREDSPRPSSKHTKKERKQNRSTRIHSLKKQLARRSLPSTIQQEKERELAALLHEQDKTKIRKEAKKTLEKYHYVRFVERQKAEKRLKQLRKQLQTEPEDEELGRKIYDMEVNRNYAIYAPLDQKYISVFVSESGKVEDAHNDIQDRSDSKPPMWRIVAETMKQGQSALEALRDGRTRVDLAEQRRTTELDEEEGVEPRSSTTRPKHNVKKGWRDGVDVSEKRMRAAEEVEGVMDDDMSDGGFFAR